MNDRNLNWCSPEDFGDLVIVEVIEVRIWGWTGVAAGVVFSCCSLASSLKGGGDGVYIICGGNPIVQQKIKWRVYVLSIFII